MTEKPLISVAMCAYNGERFISEQLKSIQGQTRLPDELIICDDASLDSTVQIARQFAAKAPFPVKISVNGQRLGVVRNFEKAVKTCSGSIIFLSDQDDLWIPEKISRMEEALRKDRAASYVLCDAIVTDEKLSATLSSYYGEAGLSAAEKRSFGGSEQKNILIKIGQSIAGCTMAFRAPLPGWVLPFPQEIKNGYHDGWIALCLTLSSHYGIFLNEPLVKYRQHCLQSSRGVRTGLSRFRKMRQTDENVLMEIEAFFSAALKRLVSLSLIDDTTAVLLKEKVEHLKIRRMMRKNGRLKRMPFVLNEALSRKYEKFSLGWKSALRDLLIK